LCEGYLGIKPHFELWRYFFVVSLLKKREKNKLDLSVLMGCADIHLPGPPGQRVYVPLAVKVQQGVACAMVLPEERRRPHLPEFTGRLIEETPQVWG
jgi:hypothetical protein